jgi:hypothetical protein
VTTRLANLRRLPEYRLEPPTDDIAERAGQFGEAFPDRDQGRHQFSYVWRGRMEEVEASFEKVSIDADPRSRPWRTILPRRAYPVAPSRRFFPPSILDWRDNEPRSEASSLTSVDAVERAVADRSRNFVAPLKVERLGAR